MNLFEPEASSGAAQRDTVRSVLLLTVVAVALTLGIMNGVRMLADPAIDVDPIQYAPISW